MNFIPAPPHEKVKFAIRLPQLWQYTQELLVHKDRPSLVLIRSNLVLKPLIVEENYLLDLEKEEGLIISGAKRLEHILNIPENYPISRIREELKNMPPV